MPYDARAVLFDAGSTLLLPTADIPNVYLREAAAIGAEPDPAAFRAHLSACWSSFRDLPLAGDALRTSERGERAMWSRLTAEVARPFPDLAARHAEWLDRLVAWFDAPRAWTPAPGAVALLTDLRSRGIRLGVVSNWHGALHGILDGLGLRPRFDFVLVSSEHGWRKPHPSIYEAALANASVVAADAVHVGDALRDDVRGAADAGIRPILIAPVVPPGLPARVRCVSGLDALLES